MDVALNDVLEIKYYCTLNNQLGINLRHYRVAAVTGTSASDADVIANLSSFVAPSYKGTMPSQAQYYGAGIRIVTAEPFSAPVYSAAGRGIGTAGNTPMPAQVTGVVTLNTAFSGREYRGRAYIPFPDESYLDPITGFPVAAYAVAMAAMGIVLTTARLVTASVGVGTCSVLPVLLHREEDTTSNLTGSRGNQKWGTQRRRGMYGRPNLLPF